MQQQHGIPQRIDYSDRNISLRIFLAKAAQIWVLNFLFYGGTKLIDTPVNRVSLPLEIVWTFIRLFSYAIFWHLPILALFACFMTLVKKVVDRIL